MADRLLIHSASLHAARVLLRNYFSDFRAGEGEGEEEDNIFVLHYKVRIMFKKLCKWLLVKFLVLIIWECIFEIYVLITNVPDV